MSDVIADLEARLNDAEALRPPLVAAENAALATAATATKARIAQDLQVAVAGAALLAAKTRMFGSTVVTDVETAAPKVVGAIEAEVKAHPWLKPVIIVVGAVAVAALIFGIGRLLGKW